MPVRDGEREGTTALAPGPRVHRNPQMARSRRLALVAVALVVVVITVSTLAHSGVSKSLAAAQHHYLRDVTPVEQADVIFNGGGSDVPDHSTASTRSLELALGKEFNELQRQKWPAAAKIDIAHLAGFSRAEYLLLQRLASAPSAKRSAILRKQSILLDDVESTNISVLRELKLPTPTNVRTSVAPPKRVP
jgi:hypothetical protein